MSIIGLQIEYVMIVFYFKNTLNKNSRNKKFLLLLNLIIIAITNKLNIFSQVNLKEFAYLRDAKAS